MTRGRIALTLIALALAAALAWGFMPKAVPVETEAAAKGRLAVTVEEEGKTRVRERYVVSAPVAGYARRIDLKVGDPVSVGQVLAVLEPTRSADLDPRSRAQARASVSAAEAAWQAARDQARAAASAAELASQNLTRTQALSGQKFVSQAAVDQARTEQQRAQAAHAAAEQSVNVARYDLEAARATLMQAGASVGGGSLNVVSPVAARVLKVVHESEGSVAAGQPLIEVGNPDTLEVEVEVLSTSAVKIAPGTRVHLDRWGGDQPLEGRVRVVEPTGFTKISALGVEEQRVRVIVDIVAPREQWARLGDGYRVEAAFVIWEGRDILTAPTSALFRHGNDWAVFVVEGGRAVLKPVRIGQRNGLRAQVLSGLNASEAVITHPDDKIAAGVKVKPR
ncbi:MAG: HlyD family efflux transporter periplasmic adaptor subunit [Hydrogenophilales bacterium]|nr:HlyD family efflux transporter periplasmic adaptor subunit [Hydrogenophilales bacterium]